MILDSDLARVYGVETRTLNQAIRRNQKKFPPDFLFQFTLEEAEEVRRSRSQTNCKQQLHGEDVQMILAALRQLEETSSWAYPEGRRLIGFRHEKRKTEQKSQ